MQLRAQLTELGDGGIYLNPKEALQLCPNPSYDVLQLPAPSVDILNLADGERLDRIENAEAELRATLDELLALEEVATFYDKNNNFDVSDGNDWRQLHEQCKISEKRLRNAESKAEETEKAMLTAKPVRPDSEFNKWTELLEEAQENEWPTMAKCKKAFEKCQAYLVRWDELDKEQTYICSYLTELQTNWKKITRDFKNKEKICKSTGFESLQEVIAYRDVWKQKQQLETEWNMLSSDGWDDEWTSWQQLLDERTSNKWPTAAECKERLQGALLAALAESDYHDHNFNPACTSCCVRRDKLNRARIGSQSADVSIWMRADKVCSQIEERETTMNQRKADRDARVKKCRRALSDCKKTISDKDGIDPDHWIVEWMALDAQRLDMEKQKAIFTEKEMGYTSRLRDLTEKQKGLGNRDAIVASLESWKHAYESQLYIDSRREVMDAECEAWSAYKRLRDEFATCQQDADDARQSYVRIQHVAASAWNAARLRAQTTHHRLNEEIGMLKRAPEYLCVKSLEFHRVHKEWDEILKLQSLAWWMHQDIQKQLGDVQNKIRQEEAAIAWREQHATAMSARERLWEQWRAKRDVLQATYQRLIGGASGADSPTTFKDWIYDSYVIPLLEHHINSFLGAVGTPEPLRIEIEGAAGARGGLGFTVYDRGNKTTFGLSSGFQQFIIGLALRLALTRLGGRGHCFQTLIIDEGFVACDVDNVQLARDILQHMMEVGGFRHILLATHLETIKDMVPRKIPIFREGAFSRLQVGPRMHIQAAEKGVAKPKRGRPKKELVTESR
jgi:DNA repair exonuclease SbcCD ATPase subunit